MAGWFARLMQKTRTRADRPSARAGFSKNADVVRNVDARDARYDAIVQMLRDRAVEDQHAREKRQRWYSQHVKSDAGMGRSASSLCSPIRLYKFRTKVPCRATPEARALLDALRKRFSGSTVTFPQITSRDQAVMLKAGAATEAKEIGWVEQCVETDAKLCNVRNHGLVVETDGGTMLVLRFRYPSTGVRMSSTDDADEVALPRGSHAIERRACLEQEIDGQPRCGIDEVARVDFTEIRPALDLRPSDKGASPRLVWLTRPEVETLHAVGSRDYEAFYVRFKREVLGGVWSSLSGLLSSSPGSRWHEGSHYTVERKSDSTTGKIHQRTVDDSGRAVDIGADRIYDAFPATDIVLLYLDGDILADVADIYFTLQSLGSTDAYFLKEEFFAILRRFWASSQSLASHYGSDLPAVVRMAQRALPMPAQIALLKQDWTNLRQSLVDRYGAAGRKAADLAGADVYRPRLGLPGWPFASSPTGEVNIGLRLVYRQEWRHLGAQRGHVIAPGTRARRGTEDLTSVETIVQQGDATTNLDTLVNEVTKATVEEMKWPLDGDGRIGMGIRGLGSSSDMGLESECRESSRETSTRLTDLMRRMASRIRNETPVAASAGPAEGSEPSSSTGIEDPNDESAATRVYSRLQNRYEVLTRPAEIQNVVLVAEKLPTPAEVDLSWVRRHDWILAKVLIDESFRDALDTIGQEPAEEQGGRLDRDPEVDAKRDRLYEHLRANILHYQRAIWHHEDPQQRSMRYRKSGKKVPLEWRFELESGDALTIDELADRLTATNVDGQFAAYSAGREADLDQVIDGAGPIGYYGNYAIYHMRPEFGGGDLFSMLHFFKSPYLRANPETGAPEVEDPMQIDIAQDPSVLAASDDVLEHHRDEMLQYVPELRLELARARKKVIDGTDSSAVDRLERQSGALRRHFATYLFRRERARQIVLDTDDVVVDVIRSAESGPGEPERRDGSVDLSAATEPYQLVLEGGQETDLLSANGHRDAHSAWAILVGAERMPSLLAGAGAAAGTAAARDREADQVMLARHEAGLTLSAVARGGAAHAPAGAILSLGDDAQPSRLLAGPGAPDTEAEARVMLVREDADLKFTAGAGGGGSDAREGLILTRSEAEQTRGLRVGGPHDHEAELVIAARGEGERVPSVIAGRAHDPDAERVILTGNDEGLRLTSVTSGEAGPAHERVILARDDEWLRPSPVAE